MNLDLVEDTGRDELSEATLMPTPQHQLLLWLEDAIVRESAVGDIVEPAAMSLSTIDRLGYPRTRTVFMRFLDGRGPGFVSFKDSRKSIEMAANPKVCALMTWHPLGREVQIRGLIEQINDDDLDTYWESRPRGSQITAIASKQTGSIATRGDLETLWQVAAAQYHGKEIPRPDYFTGWRINVTEIEFLQMRDERLHDRILFTNPGALALDAPGWLRTRLMP